MIEKKQAKESDLVQFIDAGVSDSIVNKSYKEKNKKFFDYYNSEPFGDEEEGLSQYVSSDVENVVDGDCVSLARVFLGGDAPVEFVPVGGGESAVAEADDMNKYVQWVLKTIPNSYKKQLDLLKEISLQTSGYVQYGIKEEEKSETKVYKGLDPVELQYRIDSLENESGVESVEVEKDDEDGDITVVIKRKKQSFFLMNIPWEDMIIPSGIQCKDDADVFGKRFKKKRGALIAEGYDKDLIEKIPAADDKSSDEVKIERFSGEAPSVHKVGSRQWANEEVCGVEVYIQYDFDGDDVPERRQVIKCSDIVLVNEPFDHIPFAGCSAITMPHNISGKSRAEITCNHQRVNSVLNRALLDNIYSVNLGRTYVDDSLVNMEDQLNAVKLGTIRTKGAPSNSVLPEPVPYSGDKTLQVIQYMDSQNSQTTGSIISNQALTSDQLNEETATRFTGIKELGLGKIELVARNIAEMLYKDLFEGIAWFARHYQDSEQEFYFFGRQMKVNPSSWAHEHSLVSMVGTGAGDDEKARQTLASILAIQSQEIAQGSPLADSKKKYNVLRQLVRASGLYGINNYFNDPEVPQEVLLAEYEKQVKVNQMLQQQVQQNPLAEAELIRARAKMAEVNQRDGLKAQEMKQDMLQFMMKLKQDDKQAFNDMVLALTKLELDSGRDIPGAAI